MFRLLILTGLLCCGLIMVNSTGDMGKGVWRVKYIAKCEEEHHKFKFDISQNKINRTHDGFNAHLQLNEEFNKKFAIHVVVCKDVDGGCKPYQVLSENCFIDFIEKYAKDNVKACLELAGVNPPEFPVAAGEYEVKDYIFNYSELPDDGPYGEYCAKGYMLEGNEEVGCVEMHVEFSKVDDDDYGDDDDV